MKIFATFPTKDGDHDARAAYIGGKNHSPAPIVMPVMMTNTTIMEEQLAHMTKLVEGLVVFVQSQYAKIDKLMDKIENANESNPFVPKQTETHNDTETSKEKAA